jgi:SSS family solute:Na+ symporter
LLITRVFLFLIAAFLLIWSMWYELGQDLWDYMAVSGAIYFTGAFAIMIGGLYWQRASRVGAMLALATGPLALLGLEPMQRLCGVWERFQTWGLTSAHVGLITALLAVVMMIAGSLAFPESTRREVQG